MDIVTEPFDAPPFTPTRDHTLPPSALGISLMETSPFNGVSSSVEKLSFTATGTLFRVALSSAKHDPPILKIVEPKVTFA